MKYALLALLLLCGCATEPCKVNDPNIEIRGNITDSMPEVTNLVYNNGTPELVVEE